MRGDITRYLMSMRKVLLWRGTYLSGARRERRIGYRCGRVLRGMLASLLYAKLYTATPRYRRNSTLLMSFLIVRRFGLECVEARR